MKKILAFTLSLILATGAFTGCGSSGSKDKDDKSSSSSSKGSSQSELDDAASKLVKAFCAALTNLEENGTDILGEGYIASDGDHTYLSDSGYNSLIEEAAGFFGNINDYAYVVYIKSGTATEVYVADSMDSQKIGTYPKGLEVSGTLNDAKVEETTTTTEAGITTAITTTEAAEEPTTEPEPLGILPGSKASGKNIVPGLKLGMKKDEVFNSMEISYDKEEAVRNDEGAYDYYYNLDSIELFDINECAQFYVRFDSSEKLALYGYHVGRDKNNENILSQKQLSLCYDKAYSYLVDCFGKPSEESTNADYNIGNVRWLNTEIGDISIICGTNMWGIEGYNDLMICVEGKIKESTNKTFDFTADEFVKEYNAKVPVAFGSQSMTLSRVKNIIEDDETTKFYDYEFMDGMFTISLASNADGYVKYINVASSTAISSFDDTKTALAFVEILLSPYIVINNNSGLSDILSFISTMESSQGLTIEYKGSDDKAKYFITSGSVFGSIATITPST